MIYSRFDIRNFKGIKEATVDLSSRNGKVFTLIGLNESGKTTILQSLAFFYENVVDAFGAQQTFLHTSGVRNHNDLRPKDQMSFFSDSVTVSADCQISSEEARKITQLLTDSGYNITTSFSHKFIISVKLEFVNSSLVRKNGKNVSVELSTDLKVTPKKGRNRELKPISEYPEAYTTFRSFIVQILPSIIYYPNFLFEFPDRIYLEKYVGETTNSVFYREFLQDVLHTINKTMSIKDHLLDRAKSQNPQDREPLNATINQIKNTLSKIANENVGKIIGDNRRFDIEISAPEPDSDQDILLTSGKEEEPPTRTHPYFVQLQIREGINSYFIRERSLGFKWLFSFALLTYFRLRRNTSSIPIFVFDEPASNLHQRAQQQILDAMLDLVNTSQSYIIYSTHSHHLINLDWLETAYVVENAAADYSKVDTFSDRPSDIKAVQYSNFVVGKKGSLSYIQPILDKLEYRPGNLENVPNIIITEGKSDYYIINYLNEIIFDRSPLSISPGTSVTSTDPLVRLYIGWNRPLLVLMDSDAEGSRQKGRYLKSYPTHKKSFITYEDIDPKFKNFQIENFLEDIDRREIIQAVSANATDFSKEALYLSVQLLLLNKQQVDISDKSKQRINVLLDFLHSFFG